MRFDWLAFLRNNRIEYVTRGQSTSRNNVNIKCPLCGSADSGFRMGISLQGKGWHCWRNEAHAGKSNAKLIQLLLRCTPETAHELAGGSSAAMPLDEDVGLQMRARMNGEKLITRKQTLKLLPEFKPLDNGALFSKPYVNYLIQERHYKKQQIKWLAETYNLHYCSKGPFAARIIIPIYDQWGKLLTWTARSIRTEEELRYRALGRLPWKELPAGLVQPQEALFGLRYLWTCPDPRVLLIVEGPFDAMWMTMWGRSFGVYATCLFGLNISQEQITLIEALQERFERRYLMLDAAASLRAFRLANSGLSLPVKRLAAEVKDPAELPAEDAVSFAVSCLG